MAWPDDSDLTVDVEAAFGADVQADPGTWSWTSLSSRLRAIPISLRAGRSGGASRVSPGTCSVTLVNDDAALTPLHPMSPYWPDVELGTPLRVRVHVGGVWHDRFSGFADQWEPTYIPTGVVGEMASAMRITASGILRRVQQGNQAALSPLRRTIGATAPIAYYPGEDGVLAGAAGSAVASQPPMVVSGVVDFSNQYDTGPYRLGMSALADLASGGSLSVALSGTVAAATASRWTVHTFGAFDVSYSSGDIVLMEWTTGGTFSRWRLVELKATTRTQVIAYTPGGSPTVVIDDPGVQGGYRTWAVSAEQVGGNIKVTYWLDSNTSSVIGLVGGTLGGVASMTVNQSRTTSTEPMPFGHLAVWATNYIPYTVGYFLDTYGGLVYPPSLSYSGEPAHLRLTRVCAEDGIALNMPAVPAEAVQRMGWQPTATSADLRQECEAVDGGLLYESGFGLGYLPRSARYNQPPTLTIDLATYAVEKGAASPLVPVYDDQNIRNEWTVQRREGSFAVASDPTSQRRGVYPDSVELNLEADAQLPGQAAWRVHLTSDPDLREQAFPIDLAANPGLLDGWLSCQVGSRIVRTNPPAQHRPGPVDRIVWGWTETIGPRSWLVQVNPAPAAPWDVATADGPQRAPGDGSTLAAPLTSSGMSMLLTSTPENGPWTQDPSDFPLPIAVGGERVTASAIGPGFADPFTRTSSGGWANGWTVVQGTAANFAVNGSAGVISLTPVNTVHAITQPVDYIGPLDFTVSVLVTVTPTGSHIYPQIQWWRTSANDYYRLELEVRTDSTVRAVMVKRVGGVNSDIGSFDTVTGLTHSTTVPIMVRIQADNAVTDNLRARVWRQDASQPAGWTLVRTDASLTHGSLGLGANLASGNTNTLPVPVRFDDLTVTMPQAVTLSARAVNGVTRAWPAGTPVDVWEPAIAPL